MICQYFFIMRLVTEFFCGIFRVLAHGAIIVSQLILSGLRAGMEPAPARHCPVQAWAKLRRSETKILCPTFKPAGGRFRKSGNSPAFSGILEKKSGKKSGKIRHFQKKSKNHPFSQPFSITFVIWVKILTLFGHQTGYFLRIKYDMN